MMAQPHGKLFTPRLRDMLIDMHGPRWSGKIIFVGVYIAWQMTTMVIYWIGIMTLIILIYKEIGEVFQSAGPSRNTTS